MSYAIPARRGLALALACALAILPGALPAFAASRNAGPGNAAAAVAGGPELAGHGVIADYPAHGHLAHLAAVPAAAWVVADAGSGAVLAARDPHGWYPPASTLKVLTAVALMRVLSPGRMLPASRRAAGAVPSKVGLVAGHSYRVSDLFRALLLVSANDAAVALDQGTGSYRRGMALINAEARHLRAGDTVAKRPNGLDAPGQHVSAYDEALFARAALAMPWFMRIERLRTARFPLTRRRTVTLVNQNTMLRTFPGDLGGKIGWTSPAKATFTGWARRGGHTLVVTVLHATPGTELRTAAKLLSWGFQADGKVRPVGRLVSPLPAAARQSRGEPGRRAAIRPLPTSLAGRIAAGTAGFAAALLLGGWGTIVLRRRRAASG